MDAHQFPFDPRTLNLDERRAMAAEMQAAQSRWHPRLQRLVEPPALEPDFPAFLMATAPFAELARRLDGAAGRAQVPPAAADELDWFVAAFRDYLRSCDGEDAFALPPAR